MDSFCIVGSVCYKPQSEMFELRFYELLSIDLLSTCLVSCPISVKLITLQLHCLINSFTL